MTDSSEAEKHREDLSKALAAIKSACLKKLGKDGKYAGTVECSTDWLVDSIANAIRTERLSVWSACAEKAAEEKAQIWEEAIDIFQMAQGDEKYTLDTFRSRAAEIRRRLGGEG